MQKELYWSLFESTGDIEFYIRYRNLKNQEAYQKSKV